MIRQWYCY